MSDGDIEGPEDFPAAAAQQPDAEGSEPEPEPVETPSEADETTENATFNSIHHLNQHASRLIAALYSLSKRLRGPEFEFILTKQAADLAKGKVPTDPKLASFFTQDLVAEWGHRLRPVYAVAAHAMHFQQRALRLLRQLSKECSDLDVTWNYVFALPVMRLFGNYVKILLWLPQIDFFVHALNMYSFLLVQAQVADRGLVAVLEFMRAHEDARILDAEFRPCTEFFASFFQGILPSLQVALGPGTTFPWKMVSLIDAPKVMLPSDLFFRPGHLILLHLSDFCEWLLLFGLVCLHYFQNDQAFMDTLALVYSYVIVVHVCGDVNLDLKPLFLQFKKIKRLSDIDILFLETAETQWGRQRISQGFRRQRLAVALHDLLSAIEVDEGVLCTRFGFALSLLGFAGFEITNAFKLRQVRPQWQPYEPSDLNELLYYFMRLNCLFGNSFGKLQRFIVFNAHEYDANYLETLVLSFALPSPIFLKVRALIQALRQIDIEEYDNGTVFDISRCPLVIDSISVAFNAYGLARGITHIHPLLQLLAGISMRFHLYHESICGLLEFTKAETFWHYLDCLGDIVNTHGDWNTRFNGIVLLCYHFMGLDLAAISEVDGLKDQIQKHYDSTLQVVSQTVITWYKAVLDMLMDAWNPMTGPDAFQEQRAKSLPANTMIQKATFTLQTVHAIGMIRVVDTDHNVAQETILRVEQMMKIALVRDKTERGPQELEKRFQIGKWVFQQICSAASLVYQRTVMRNTNALASEASQGGAPLAVHYRALYCKLARVLLPETFFSNTQEMFLGQAGKKQTAKLAASYMTLPALQALRRILKKEGCVLLHRALAQVAGEVAKVLIDAFLKILSGPSSVFDSAILQLADVTSLMKAFGHVCAILKLRQMVGQFTRIIPRVVLPHEDKELVGHMKNAGMASLVQNPRATELFGSLLASSYWEAFDYDVENDAMNDNSHLWAKFFDALVAFAVAAQSRLTPRIFYRQLFARCVNSINKGRQVFGSKRKTYPGLQLLIVVDHMVSESQYADYSHLEAFVPYQLIRSLYTAKLSIIGDSDVK